MAKKWDTGQSLVWNYLVRNREEVEKHITWRIHSGSCSFWWDDWLGVSPLAHYTIESLRLNNTIVSQFFINGQWNETKIRKFAPILLIP